MLEVDRCAMWHDMSPSLTHARLSRAQPVGATGCQVKSIWEGGKELGPVAGGVFSAQVPAGDVVFVIISGCSAEAQ